MSRDRTLPAAALPGASYTPPGRNFRVFVDASVLFTVAGLLIGGGMAWQRFLDDGKRLDQHDQEIATLTQIQQQQAVTNATLVQNVQDIKDSLNRPHGGQ